MAVYRICITPYIVQRAHDANGTPYDVRDSLIEILLHRSLHLNAAELLTHHSIATRIEQAEGDYCELAEDDYLLLREACERIRGYGREDVELVQRIMYAEKRENSEDML